MPKPRGKEHTTLTETALQVVRELQKLPNIKMIAPGEIKTTRRNKSGKRHLTATENNAGLQIIITGQSVQKVAVHTETPRVIYTQLEKAKSLRDFAFSYRPLS